MLAPIREAVSPLPMPDQSAFVTGILDQGMAGSCTGFGTVAALDQYLRANGHEAPAVASPLFPYVSGRLQEWAGLNPSFVPPLQDTGAEPILVLRAMQRLGYVSWDDCPYPKDTATLYDSFAMAQIVNRPIAPAIYASAYALRGMQWASIQVGPGCLDLMAEALQHRLGVAFGMYVDSAYMHNHGDIITSVDITDPRGGGHWQAAVAVSDDMLKVRGSWGTGVGAAGRFFLDRSVVEDPKVTREILVIQFAEEPEL